MRGRARAAAGSRRDTDTNAAIAGGLLGARDGLPAIPTGWVEILQFRQEFLAAAHRLSSRSRD